MAPAYAAQPTALLDLPGADAVELICVHASAPALAPNGAARWRAELAALPAPGELPRVVAGDFNATLDHAAFRGLLRLGYADAAQQAGEALTPTWGPTGKDPLLALDHVLVNRGCAVSRARCTRCPAATTGRSARRSGSRRPPAKIKIIIPNGRVVTADPQCLASVAIARSGSQCPLIEVICPSSSTV